MEKSIQPKKKKRNIFKYLILFILLGLTGLGIYLYSNFNKLLSDALLKTFNANIISDVYELKFDDLKVNPVAGNIGVRNVVFQPREKALKDYPYINSYIILKTERLNLSHVDLFKLLKEGKLELDAISIIKPEVQLTLDSVKNVLFPYTDAASVKDTTGKKRGINGFRLKQFEMISANFEAVNKGKENNLKMRDFSITLKDLILDQQPAKDYMSFKQVSLIIGETNASLKKLGIQKTSLLSYDLSIDSLVVTRTVDTVMYRFKDFSTVLKGLAVQTADSANTVSLGSFAMSYKHQSIQLRDAIFKPNLSDLQIQRKFKYQQPNFSGSVKKVAINKVNFDSLIYYKKVYIDEIVLDSLIANIYKDKLKPLDLNRFPEYFGQQIAKIPIPLLVKSVSASNITLYNTERKPDSTIAKVSLNRATASLQNITNLSDKNDFVMKAGAYIDNKVYFNVTLNFSYVKPQFGFSGHFKKFNLMDLNHLVQGYTPAKLTAGFVDEISFSGIAEHRTASGDMKFLYHDLKLDLELKNQQKWKSSVVAFAANSIVPSNNPSSPTDLPRLGKFKVDRDMNKGFINIVIKSVITGLKESVITFSTDKKTYQAKFLKTKQQFFGDKKKK